MFNDVNNPNNQGHLAVDDIFAETDKPGEGGAAGSSIETRRVGLTALDSNDASAEAGADKNGNKWFKISLTAIIAAIVILSGYLVYSKFFKASPEVNSPLNTAAPASNNPAPLNNNQSQTPVTPPTDSNSFVTPTSGEIATETSPQIPGVNAPATTSLSESTTTAETVTSDEVTDSDNDGLSNADEKERGTNSNVVDTDNDGLSDYEEVKIYHTNPLNADTDGDGYSDGVEVKGGYDPNGPGKLTNTLK